MLQVVMQQQGQWCQDEAVEGAETLEVALVRDGPLVVGHGAVLGKTQHALK